jgi:hypothetical protein
LNKKLKQALKKQRKQHSNKNIPCVSQKNKMKLSKGKDKENGLPRKKTKTSHVTSQLLPMPKSKPFIDDSDDKSSNKNDKENNECGSNASTDD